MLDSLSTAHGDLALPAFLPDATRGVARAVAPDDLVAAGIRALVVNAVHLSRDPGASVVESAGGIHRFMGWDGPVLSDSGGFQIYSLISRSKSSGQVTEEGFTFRLGQKDKKTLLTPEGCIELQLRLGADIVVCLDYCTHPRQPEKTQRESVDRTIAWARRAKDEFLRRIESGMGGDPPPLLFAVVQGGNDPALRRMCVERLVEIGFDGYGFGGWPAGDDGALTEMVGLTAGLLPREAPKMGLGIGKLPNVVAAFDQGYTLFDCTIPTRDGRRGTLYILERPDLSGECFRSIQISDERYVRDGSPVDPACDCLCCRGHSRSYLRHLFEIEDSLAYRLASIHNLRTYSRLMGSLRARRAS